MSNNSRLLVVFISAIIVALILLGLFSNSFANSNPSSIVTQPTPTPETQTLTPTLAPTPTITPRPALIPVPVDFTCNARSPYTFNVTVTIDLNDGMNSAEALMVANKIFEHELTNATYEVKSAEANDAGIWTVYLLWGAVSPEAGMKLMVTFLMS